jgi:copper transport protein
VKRLVAFGVIIAGLLGMTLLTAPSASAHATVVASDPVDGSRLKAAPSSVSITFDEGITLNSEGYLRVVDQAGRRVDSGQPSHPAGPKIMVAVKAGLGDGTYTASFRIISADGHPVAGAIRFVVGNGELAAGAAAPSTVDGATSVVFDIVRWVAFAGLALLGGGWLLLTIWPEGRDDRRARRLLWGGWLATTVGALAELVVQGPYASGTGLGDLGNGSLLDATLHTTYGTAHSIRLLLLGGLGVVLGAQLRDPRRSRLAEATAALGIGVVLTYAASGHAESENPRWLTMTSYSAHLAAMAVWLGGLVYLLVAVLPRREPAELRRVLPVFSRTAMGCVIVLAVSGTYQAWLGIGSIEAITGTRYGQLVLVKAGLFLGILGLANVSRVVVQRRYVRPVAYAMTDTADPRAQVVDPPKPPKPPSSPAPPVSRMRRSVLAEAVVAVGVLAVTAVLVAEPPGRAALAAQHEKARSATVALGNGRTAIVTLDPGRSGPVTVTVRLAPAAVPAPQVSATAALPDKQLGPITIPLRASGSGYTASGIVLPSPGRWIITLTIKTSEFDSVVADAKIRLY